MGDASLEGLKIRIDLHPLGGQTSLEALPYREDVFAAGPQRAESAPQRSYNLYIKVY